MSPPYPDRVFHPRRPVFPRPALPIEVRSRRARRSAVRVALVSGAAAATIAAPAGAAQRFEVFDTPSLQGNIESGPLNRLNGTDALRTTVLLPDGYDEQPGRAWPVVYLLHGAEDNTSTWRDPATGDVAAAAAGLPAIAVMPEGGRGYYTDHWLGGSRKGANWERYFLDEVVPAVESRYRISPSRQDHAILGPSMGGLGALLFAAQLPGYFGSVVSMSGLNDLEDLAAQYILPPASMISYPRYWGPFNGQYVKGHSPKQLLGNLVQTRMRVSTGNGIVDPRIGADLRETILGGVTEAASWQSTFDIHRRARAAGVPSTISTHVGIHDWPYWKADLRRAIAWGFFRPLPGGTAPDPTSFSYRTIAPRGNAWGLGYRFAELPSRVMELRRADRTVSATGSGTVTIAPGAAASDTSGIGTKPECTFTAVLPFTYELPAGC